MRLKSKTTLLLIQICWVLCTRADSTPVFLWQETYGFTTTALAVSPDGKYAASPGNGGVQIWRVADGSKVVALAFGSEIANLAFSPDGLYLASLSASASYRLSLWRVSDWSLVYALSGVQSPALAFSRDSSRLAVASNTVIQLRVATNGVLLTSWTNPPLQLGGINTLAFSPDGTKLASGAGARGADLNLKIWSVPSGNLLLNIPTAQTYTVGLRRSRRMEVW
jgi:WD40 repeat protein